jgi:single-strand DNA-binding protein
VAPLTEVVPSETWLLNPVDDCHMTKTVRNQNNKRNKIRVEPECKNQVLLIGRVKNPAIERMLPSGDKVVEFRIIIDRKSRRGKRREIDTLDVAAWSSVARKRALAIAPDTWVEISGAVRRRFWQAPSGLTSRWQVEAESITRLIS